MEVVCSSVQGGVVTSGGGFSVSSDRETDAPWQAQVGRHPYPPLPPPLPPPSRLFLPPGPPQTFSKYGMIKEDEKAQPRIKLYRDKVSGMPK